MAISSFIVFLSAGAKIKHVLLLIIIGAIVFAGIAFSKPYIMERLSIFFDIKSDNLDSGYQVRQSLIALGTGGTTGRGFGQSVQKFNFLPEPVGDSIFAVAGEEFGFLGTSTIVLLFIFFASRGIRIALHTKDRFGVYLVVGIVSMIVVQAFINILAMTALFPMSGLTIPFISHGGTSLLITLFAVGLILNVSRHQKVEM
jgi:cell division protein FtsW